MIKIISGHSEKGGSTVAFINLTNALNNKKTPTIFYGPHQWHLNKCKSDLLQNLRIEKNDVLITHFMNLGNRPNVKKVILSCHEKNLFEVGSIKQFWDVAVFLNKKHRDYHHSYNGKYVLIPNLKENLKNKIKPELDLIAGVIGTFDENKQTHISIERALKDGCERVYLFGDPNSSLSNFKNKIEPLLSDKVILKGYYENKQEIYDMIGRVYHSSLSEVATLVKDECETTGTKFFGNESTNYIPIIMNNQEIIQKWIEIIKK